MERRVVSPFDGSSPSTSHDEKLDLKEKSNWDPSRSEEVAATLGVEHSPLFVDVLQRFQPMVKGTRMPQHLEIFFRRRLKRADNGEGKK